MRTALAVVLTVLSGCTSRPPHVALQRTPVTLDSLAVDVRNDPRSFFLSDKTGGFLVGHLPEDIAGGAWSVDGEPAFSGVSVGGSDSHNGAAHTRVYPTKVVSTLSDGTVLRCSITSFMAGPTLAHALRLDVHAGSNSNVSILPHPGQDWKSIAEMPPGSRRWENHRAGLVIEEYVMRAGGDSPMWTSSTLYVLRESGRTSLDSTVFTKADEALQARERSLLAKLNSLYIRTGDSRLNRAAWWTKATLDALIIEMPEVSVVSSLPWSGTYSGRKIARSFVGLALTEPDPLVVGAVVRWFAGTQQKNASLSTYGRLASTFSPQSRDYAGADVTPDFARFAYDYITASRDTAMIRVLYQLLQRSIAGTMKYHTDTLGFLVHGDHETWMDGSSPATARGNRAVEIQSSWYYQQLVGSFVAEWVKDSVARRQWTQGAAKTISHFNKLFVDSTNNFLFDHITADGQRISEDRPNALYCLDLLHSEDLQQNIIRRTMEHNVYHKGVGTLSPDDPRFVGTIRLSGEENAFNGPIWTWLNAQAVYSLTRYDRQDLAYILTSHLVEHVLDVGMVGGLPATLSVGPASGGMAEEGNDQCSVDAEAEFIRGFYQDYLGITVDATSNEVSLHPKLLRELFPVDCTVLIGRQAVRITYQMADEVLQVALDCSDLTRPAKLAFLFTLPDGIAWQGAAVLLPQTTMKLDFDSDNVVSLRGEEQFHLEPLQRLVGFSQRNVFTGLHFADEKLKGDSTRAVQ